MHKLVLHVGTHKTGTTSIQAFLRRNKEALSERGIFLPTFDVRWPQRVAPGRNGYFLNRAALREIGAPAKMHDGRQIALCMESFGKQLEQFGSNDEHTVLLTDERMWYSGALNQGYWEAIKTFAMGFGLETIRVVLYIRRQDQFAEALWNQFVKATKSTEALKAYISSPHVVGICDYYGGIKELMRVFGRENVLVSVYDRERLKNGDVIDDFCDLLGIPLNDDYERPASQKTNPRLNNNLVEVKRIANMSVEYQQLNNAFGANFAHAMQMDDWTGETDLLSYEERMAFLGRFEQGNRLLAEDYFGGTQLFKMPEQGGEPLWKFDAEGMLRDTVLVFADALASQEKRIRELEAKVVQLERAREQSSREGHRASKRS